MDDPVFEYNCPVSKCGYSGNSRRKLMKHSKSFHPNKKLFISESCHNHPRYITVSLRKMLKHLDIKHADEESPRFSFSGNIDADLLYGDLGNCLYDFTIYCTHPRCKFKTHEVLSFSDHVESHDNTEDSHNESHGNIVDHHNEMDSSIDHHNKTGADLVDDHNDNETCSNINEDNAHNESDSNISDHNESDEGNNSNDDVDMNESHGDDEDHNESQNDVDNSERGNQSRDANGLDESSASGVDDANAFGINGTHYDINKLFGFEENTGVGFAPLYTTKKLPRSCTICNKLRVNLNQHMLTHSNNRPYKCSLCYYETCRRTDMKLHMLSHTQVRTFSCWVCAKAFLSSSDYKKHMKIHISSRKYRCQICDRTFLHKHHMKNHIFRKHGRSEFEASQSHD